MIRASLSHLMVCATVQLWPRSRPYARITHTTFPAHATLFTRAPLLHTIHNLQNDTRHVCATSYPYRTACMRQCSDISYKRSWRLDPQGSWQAAPEGSGCFCRLP